MIRDNLENLTVIPLDELEIGRNSFSCSVKPLEEYFHKYVSQDVKKGLAKCFVLIDHKTSEIIGYYTLSALSVLVSDIPQERIAKGIPYPNILAVLMGRLAVDDRFQKQGYGKFLIVDAMYKVKNTAIGTALLVVDAKDDSAVEFYKNLGFIEFTDLKQKHRKLFYPLTNLTPWVGTHGYA